VPKKRRNRVSLLQSHRQLLKQDFLFSDGGNVLGEWPVDSENGLAPRKKCGWEGNSEYVTY